MATPAPASPRPESATELKRVIEAERAGEPFLLYRHPDGEHRLLVLASAGAATIGRRQSTDVPLEWDTEVSRAHATLERFGGEWTIADDGLSRNGTYVNGSRIRGRVRLQDGDTVRCGRTTLMFRAPGQGPSEMTFPSEDMPTVEGLSDTQRRVLIALCRPFRDSGSFAAPASNRQIAEEVFLSVDAVKTHLRLLFQKLGLQDLPRNEKRMHLVESAFQWGLVGERDLQQPQSRLP